MLAAAATTFFLLLAAVGFFGARLVFGGEEAVHTGPVGLETPADSSARDGTEPEGGSDAAAGNRDANIPSATETDDSTSNGTGEGTTVSEGTYVNGRYGFSINVPAGWSGTESHNGDGIVLTSPTSAASAFVSGTNTVLPPCSHSDVEHCQREVIAEREAGGVEITYQESGDNWFVVSGKTSDGQGNYERWYLGDGSSTVLSVDFPMSEVDALDAVVTELSKSLRPGDLTVPH